MGRAEEEFQAYVQDLEDRGIVAKEDLVLIQDLLKEILLPEEKGEEEFSEEYIKKMIEEAVDKRAEEFSEEERKEQKRALRDFFLEGKMPYEVLNVSKAEREALFQEGRLLFQAGRYDEALQLFEGLSFLDPTSQPVIFSVAACYHAKKEYAEAAGRYYVSSKMDPESPLPLFYLSDCFSNLNLKDLALDRLEACLSLCKKNSAYSQLEGRVRLMVQQLEKETSAAPKT